MAKEGTRYRRGGGGGGISFSLINHLQCKAPSLGSLAIWQSQLLSLLRKVRREGANFTSERKIFHRAGATAEKTVLLNPAS